MRVEVAVMAIMVIQLRAIRVCCSDNSDISAKSLSNELDRKNYWHGGSHLPGKLMFKDRHSVQRQATNEFNNLFLTDEVINRGAIRDPKKLWPNARVPYVISSDYGKLDRMMIKRVMDDFHKHTCVRFVLRTNEANYVNITHTGNGCHSNIGMQNDGQIVSLDRNGCFYTKLTPTHELMHALGFYHEHARHDRDRHVVINHHNVQFGKAINFKKQEKSSVQHLGVPYDHNSVMHYSADEFSIDGKKPTITRTNGLKQLGNDYGMTESDILKINRLYRCNPNDTCWDDDVTGCRSLLEKHGPTYCATKREEMERDCQRSCGFCGKVPPNINNPKPDADEQAKNVCIDKIKGDYCAQMAKALMCEEYTFLKTICMLSCKACN